MTHKKKIKIHHTITNSLIQIHIKAVQSFTKMMFLHLDPKTILSNKIMINIKIQMILSFLMKIATKISFNFKNNSFANPKNKIINKLVLLI